MASTLDLFRHGAVGFIDWLDESLKVHLTNDPLTALVIIHRKRLASSSYELAVVLVWNVNHVIHEVDTFVAFRLNPVNALLPVLRFGYVLPDHTCRII